MESKKSPYYHLKSGLDEIDYVKVTAMLTSAYWCQGIGLEEVKKEKSCSEWQARMSLVLRKDKLPHRA